MPPKTDHLQTIERSPTLTTILRSYDNSDNDDGDDQHNPQSYEYEKDTTPSDDPGERVI